MNVSFDLNMDGNDSDGLLFLTEERIKQLTTQAVDKLLYIAENKKDYSFKRQTPEGVKQGMHKGKILIKLLEGITSPQEQGYIISMFHVLISHLIQISRTKSMLDILSDTI